MKDPIKARARAARYRQRHRHEPAYIRRMREAAKKYMRTAGGIRARLAREERAGRLHANTTDDGEYAGMCIQTAKSLERPRFLWMDARGRLHAEYWQTPEELAEELIRERIT